MLVHATTALEMRTTAGHSGTPVMMVLAAALLFAAQDAGTKYLSHAVSLTLLLWSRYTLQAALMAVWLHCMKIPHGFRTHHLPFQLLRGLLLLVITSTAIFSVRHLPLAEFTAIVMLSPVLVTALASRMLNHQVGARRWLLVLGGFAGTLIMVRPGSGLFGTVVLLPFAVMLALTAYSLVTSHLATRESAYTTQFYSGVTASVATLPPLILQAGSIAREIDVLPITSLVLMAAIAMFSTLGHLLLAMAFGRMRAAALMPFTYTQIGFAAVLSWVVFQHAPDFWAWIGMIMIAACGGTTALLNLRESTTESQRKRHEPGVLERTG